MTQRTLKIIVVLLIYFHSLEAQDIPLGPQCTQNIFVKIKFEQRKLGHSLNNPYPRNINADMETKHLFPPYYLFNVGRMKNKLRTTAGVSADFYEKCLGFFCRQELKIEKYTAIPFRFRLGTLEYVNRLEGKAISY